MHQSPADVMAFSDALVPLLRDNAAANSDGVDMQGWDGVLFLISVGATDTTVDAKAQDSADNSTFADITGAATTQWAATDDNKIKAIDVWKPSERYVRCVVTTGDGTTGANSSVVACRYRRTGRTPITQTLDELDKTAVN